MKKGGRKIFLPPLTTTFDKEPLLSAKLRFYAEFLAKCALQNLREIEMVFLGKGIHPSRDGQRLFHSAAIRAEAVFGFIPCDECRELFAGDFDGRRIAGWGKGMFVGF